MKSRVYLALLCLVGFQFGLTAAAVGEERSSHNEDAASIPRKRAIPDAAAQRKAVNQIRESLRAEYAKAAPQARQALVIQLLNAASDAGDNPTMQYALLCEARDVAAGLGNPGLASAAVDRISARYEIEDPLRMKMDALKAVARAVHTVEDAARLAEICLGLVDRMVAKDDYESAAEAAEAALSAATASRDRDLAERAGARLQDVQALLREYRRVEKAFQTLAANPDDPEACATIGRFLCFFKGDWDAGLPMLAAGGDEALKALAKRDMKGSGDPELQSQIGSDWWEVARKNAGMAKDRIQLRAIAWHQKALPSLTDPARAKIEKQIDEYYSSKGLPAGVARLADGERRKVVRRGNKLYLFVGAYMSRPDAARWCAERGARLACIANDEENEFVVNLALKEVGGGERLWAGGTDELEEGNWRWDDGSPWKFAKWSPEEPNNFGDGENYLEIMIENHCWNDTSGDDKLFVAQWIVR